MTGVINQELLLKNEYLAAENRILRAHLPARLRLSVGTFEERPRLPPKSDQAVCSGAPQLADEGVALLDISTTVFRYSVACRLEPESFLLTVPRPGEE